DLFDEIEDLGEWAAACVERHVQPGQPLLEVGRGPEGVILLLEGRARALLVRGERTEPASRHIAPTWIGAIAVLTGGALGVRMVSETACRLAVVPSEEFRRLAFA